MHRPQISPILLSFLRSFQELAMLNPAKVLSVIRRKQYCGTDVLFAELQKSDRNLYVFDLIDVLFLLMDQEKIHQVNVYEDDDKEYKYPVGVAWMLVVPAEKPAGS
jgi:hypothetical protein